VQRIKVIKFEKVATGKKYVLTHLNMALECLPGILFSVCFFLLLTIMTTNKFQVAKRGTDAPAETPPRRKAFNRNILVVYGHSIHIRVTNRFY